MLKILHLEDNLLDHKLLAAKLKEEGFEFEITRVDSRASFEHALANTNWTIIIADYNLPDFDGLKALTRAREKTSETPFIVVSGAMGEIAAVDVMKAGATDYVLKEALDRLGPAIRRAQREREALLSKEAAEQALRTAKEVAESANRAKDRFLAILSHELRTPLSPVLLTLSTMAADRRLSKEMLSDIDMMRRNIDLEIKLIDDLLDLSRITTGKLTLEQTVVDVHELLRHVLHSAHQDFSDHAQKITLQLDAIDFFVTADSARLQQVLWNLIRNSIKFTPNGGTISVRTSSNASSLEVEVTDSGVGIADEALERVFNAFEQEDRSITRRFGGLGLGLSVSKAIIEMHSGTILAHSEGIGKGARFTITLPISKNTPAAKPSHADDTQSPTSSEAKILLVEDHADTREVLTRWLESSGYHVTAASTTHEGLECASKKSFDIVVSDIGLPDATGYELMEELSTRYSLQGIALTGFGMEDDRKKSHSAGFVEHIVKPVDFFKLEEAIRRVLGTKV